jgi:hypothetical protein
MSFVVQRFCGLTFTCFVNNAHAAAAAFYDYSIMPERLDNHLRDPPMVDTGGGSQMSNRNELGFRKKDGI